MTMDDATSSKQIQIGEWIYQPNLRSLRRREDERRLKPLSDRLLRRLLREPGAVISRDQLIEEVWTRRLVNDEVLSRAIAELRAALDDDAREPRYIETLAKGGYRWIALVSEVAFDSSSSAPNRRTSDESALVPPAQNAVTDKAAAQGVPRKALLLASIAILVVAGAGWFIRTQRLVVEAPPLPPVDLLTARPLSADAGLEFDPRFNALGHVAYIRRAEESGTNELVVVDRSGQGERVLWSTDKRLRHPAPSPDGREIAVLHWPAEHCEIWMISALDGHAGKLTDCAEQTGSMLWVDSGAELLFTAPAEDSSISAPGLARVNRASRKVVRLTTPELAEGADVDPRLSFDGSQLVYASLQNGERQLWLTDWPDLRQRSALLGRPEPIYSHAFEARTNALWVAGDLVLYRAINRLVPGHSPELLGARGAQAVDIATDGAVVWTQSIYDGEIWIRQPTQTEFRNVAGSIRHESQPTFSPDGKRLALVSNRGGTEAIVIVKLGETAADDQSTMPRLDPAMRWVRPSWSPDGASLILTGYQDTHTYLYRYAIDSATLTPLSADIVDAFAGIELSDRLLFRQGAHGVTRLMEIRTGETTAVAIDIGEVSAFRANERWLVWRAASSASLRVAEINAPQQSRTIARLDGEGGEAFTLSDDWLYYASGGKIWRRLLPNGEAESLAVNRHADPERPSLAVSSGGALAVAGTERVSMDLMIALPSGSPTPSK